MIQQPGPIIFQCETFVVDIEASEKRQLSSTFWIGELVPFLLSLIIKVKNARVAEQLHRPGLFNRFFVNYTSSWIPSRFLMMIFRRWQASVAGKSSLQPGGCDFTLITSFVPGPFSFQILETGVLIMWLGETWGQGFDKCWVLSAGSQTFARPATLSSWLHIAAEDVCSLSPDKIADGIKVTN